MALLANPSPPSSPSRFRSSDPNTTMFPSVRGASDSFEEAQLADFTKRFPAQKEPGAIQFIPAYEEAVSPASTQPLTPDDSLEVTPQPKEQRISASTKPKGTRIQRLASLFSSRAVVKSMDEKDESRSPPRSEASSSYVGWPGTQDKRGATVMVESDSDVGPPETDRVWMDEEDDQKSTPRSKNHHHYDSQDESEGNPADFHLTAAVANATAAASSPMAARSPRTEVEKVHRMAAPMHSRVNSVREIYGNDEKADFDAQITSPWGLNTSDETMSDVSTSYSKTSSAYFNDKDVRAIRHGKINRVRGVGQNRNAAAAVMRFKPGVPQPPTEEALAIKNHYAPPHRDYNASNTTGYRGFLDKTKDVPNLMDETDSESTCSRATTTHSSISGTNGPAAYRRSRQQRSSQDLDDQILEEASSDIFDGLSKAPKADSTVAESDVFDGLSAAGSKLHSRRKHSMEDIEEDVQFTDPYKRTDQNFNVVLLGGGLTTIQTTSDHFTLRKTASDYDDNLTNSDCDQYGFAKIPGFNEMASRGTGTHDRSIKPGAAGLFTDPSPKTRQAIERFKSRASDHSASGSGGSDSGSSLFSNPYSKEGWGRNVYGCLNQYYVPPDEMKILVKFFRKMSKHRSPHLSFDDLERKEDATKAFALSEMRSRIMEKDIERGLERQGGTTVVDDIVLTPYHRASLRVRDALVVAKAWRDGATPQDVINTSLLTRRAERAFFILRPNRQYNRRSHTQSPDYANTPRYTWKEVNWVDDLEMSQYRCHSIGARPLRGFEMFTIGDCQSILLKLCNERCVVSTTGCVKMPDYDYNFLFIALFVCFQELRAELNVATARQIEAEEWMKEEAGFADGMMTEAEMRYLNAMEQVKGISYKLVIAEKSFNLVRDRIERLVAKYEALLISFENETESVAPSSVITYQSSYYSEYSCTSFEEREREKDTLSRRAQRAELRAEMAAREAMLAKQEAKNVQAEKERELRVLQQRLNELQSESSAAITEREHSVVLARAITANYGGKPTPSKNVGGLVSKSKIDDVKKRFRDRSASKMNNNPATTSNYGPSQSGGRGCPSNNDSSRDAAARERSSMFRSVGEEMFQQLDFYERSLKAVESTR